MNPEKTLDELRVKEYQQRLEVDRLRREVYEQPDLDPTALGTLLDELQAAERELSTIEQERARVQPKSSGVIIDTKRPTSLLSPDTTGIDAQVHLRMAQLPTSICHLLNRDQHPLVSCTVKSVQGTHRLRLTSFIDGYSAHAVDTFEIKAPTEYNFLQLPTLFPDRLEDVTELTRATLNVMLEDLDGKVELHKTEPIWLLARSAAPLAVRDPKTGEWQDMARYYGAFVTPNAPSVMKFLRATAQYHPKKRLVGYREAVEPQVKAIFEALKNEANIIYVNSLIAFSPDQGFASQRVRLPRESLKHREANCVDGTVLFASLLEGISMNPAIVVIPAHVFVAWETAKDSNAWKYLETTMIGNRSFEEACAWAEAFAKRYQQQAEATQNLAYFQRWSLKELRSIHGITPME